ncbi:MAG: glycyl-radical enzyme activating protein [Clostridia bacterium]|nr:glycyl-radical enzyme activating protein [Clostridia bacterium]
MKGTVFNIQRFCLHDGPGIRTAVFFKGCPLHCAWCHNPESQLSRAEIFYKPDSCLKCGACVQACPKGLHAVSGPVHTYDRTLCEACGACASVCPAGALELCGRRMETGEVLLSVLRDKDFYSSSGGGLTLTGGEPMAQPGFALELAQKAHEAGIHVCVETCGYCAAKDLAGIVPYTDLFLYDFKLADGEAHKRWTGADNRLIMQNLSLLSRAGADIVLRCPIIPGVNDTRGHMEDIARTAHMNPGIRQIDLEPYHPLGIEKCLRLGREAGYNKTDFLSPAQLEPHARWLKDRTGLPINVA